MAYCASPPTVKKGNAMALRDQANRSAPVAWQKSPIKSRETEEARATAHGQSLRT